MNDYKETEIVKDLDGTIFSKKIKHIWDKAVDDIHPFQKGDSHQGSLHCIKVLGYLSDLIKIDSFNNLEKYLLSCCAILHDTDKAVIDYDRAVAAKRQHGIRSAKFIRDHSDLFRIGKKEAKAIAVIAEYHGLKPLSEILDKFSLNKIDIEGANKKEREEYSKININFYKLAAVFKLADMMDVTYKRISDPIILLNFGSTLTDSKLRARQTFEKSGPDRSTILLDVWEDVELTPKQYQSVIIAIDMMNKELITTGAKDALKTLFFPYKFKLGRHTLNAKAKKFAKEREKISVFNGEERLILNDLAKDELQRTYNKISETIEFSKDELNQLKLINKSLYLEETAGSIDDIGDKFRKLFGYSIGQMEIKREHIGDGSIEGYLEYTGIKKPKMLNINPTQDLKEASEIAEFDEKVAKIISVPVLSDGGVFQKLDNAHAKVIWPETVGHEDITTLRVDYKTKGAWCEKREDISKFYSKDPYPYESIGITIMYPICKIIVIAKFPRGYNIQPSCKYLVGNQSEDIKMQYDSKENSFILDNLHQTDWTFENPPRYQIVWDVPD